MFLTLASTRPYVFLIATVLLAALSGCQMLPSTPQTAPQAADAPDQACAAGCDLAHSQCEQRQRLREEQCQQDFTQISADHAACIAVKGRQCLQPVPCLGADMGICTTQRNECIQRCGGQAAPRPGFWRWPWQKQDAAQQPAQPASS